MRPVLRGVKESILPKKPSREEAEAAVRLLLAYMGDDPNREGLLDTPKRVVAAYDQCFAGYEQSADDVLLPLFSETGGYQDMVLVRHITFHSHCEHHIMPIEGHVDLAYIPTSSIVGLSKFARLVDIFAKRLQTQERLTADIAQAFDACVPNQGVAIKITAKHACMSARGVKRHDAKTITYRFKGCFEEQDWQKRFVQEVCEPSR